MRAVGPKVPWLTALLLVAGCTNELPPEGQVVLTVWTDAPLPTEGGAEPQASGEAPALFDRLRFDIVPPGSDTPCDQCSREFGIDRAMVGAGAASIGIAPPVGEDGWRVVVRLYRSGGTLSPDPRPGSTLEKVVALPPVSSEGKVPLAVVLWTDSVATPVGTLDDPREPDAAPFPKPGSWTAARRRDCAEPPGPNEVCVPGGAYWMGDPRLDFSAAFDLDGSLERLVVLDPFYLHRTEVPVSAFRQSGLAESLTPGGPSDNPHTPTGSFPQCTYTDEPGPFEAHPTVCLSWSKAQAYCESIGARLPTEAELEYAGSRLGRSRYVWGEELPRCEDAVFERQNDVDPCGDLGVGVALPGSGQRDRLLLGDIEIVDLAGNVQEWALDRWNRQEEPCWGIGLFHNPFCDLPSPADGDDVRVLRGGDWAGDEVDLRAAVRSRLANQEQAVSARVGFRCARAATSAE